MSDALLHFRWPVPARPRLVWGEGLRVENGEPVTRTGAFVVGDGEAAWYDPLERRELLGALTRLPSESAEVGDFVLGLAGQWGLLGLEPWVIQGVWAESISEWGQELAALRDALLLWGAAESGDLEYLREPIATDAGDMPRLNVYEGSAVYVGPVDLLRIGGPGSAAEPLISPEEPIQAAGIVLGHLVNAKLRKHTSFALVIDAQERRLVTRARAESLIGAAWLQLAMSIDGEREPRRCPRCGAWFIANPAAERGHPRTYCRDTCRVEMSKKRRRQREAKANRKTARKKAGRK